VHFASLLPNSVTPLLANDVKKHQQLFAQLDEINNLNNPNQNNINNITQNKNKISSPPEEQQKKEKK